MFKSLHAIPLLMPTAFPCTILHLHGPLSLSGMEWREVPELHTVLKKQKQHKLKSVSYLPCILFLELSTEIMVSDNDSKNHDPPRVVSDLEQPLTLEDRLPSISKDEVWRTETP